MTPETVEQVFLHEIFPATGCTEPISCAYAAALAAHALGVPAETLVLEVDPGTMKNGSGVPVPNTGGQCGNLIAAALGAQIAQPELRLQVLHEVRPEQLAAAQTLLACASERVARGEGGFFVRVTLTGAGHTARCILSGNHTSIQQLTLDGQVLQAAPSASSEAQPVSTYRDELQAATLHDLVVAAEQAAPELLARIRTGIDMNLRLSEAGHRLQGTAAQLTFFRKRGYLAEDLFFKTKIAVAAAVDARMNGCCLPAMTSGSSGNQGLVTTLTVFLAGRELGVPEERILRSIVLAHLLNAYTKCFIGKLSALCGCAMSAGLSAAAALVFQREPVDEQKIAHAINNVIGDLSGMVCDGAKPGCALKAISSVDSALRSSLMALHGFTVQCAEGLLGVSVEDSIRNLGRLTREGMVAVDSTVLSIMEGKQRRTPASGKPLSQV